VPYLVAMAETVSPEATVCVPEAAAAGAAGAAGAAALPAPGMVSDWPTRMNARESRPLAATTAATVVP